MGYSQTVHLLPSSGYAGDGIGLPVLVGRNTRLDLTLDTTGAPADAVVSVVIETSSFSCRDNSDAHRVTWRELVAETEVTGAVAQMIAVTGADAFVRARYAVSLPSGETAAPLALSGRASCILSASATRTASGVSDAVSLEQYHGGRFALVVASAPGGGQTLTVTIERSADGQSGWTAAASFAVASAATEYTVETADLDAFVRVRWTLSGAGPWTFSVAGASSLIFARTRDRTLLGIRTGAIPNVTAAQYLAAFETSTETVLGDLSAFNLPLRQWGSDLRQACIALADWQLLASRSKDPAEGGNLYVVEADRWNQWLAQVGGRVPGAVGRRVRPPNVIDSTPPERDGTRAAYKFASDPPRDSRRSRRVVY
jgi:hypothetical protein